MTSMPPPPMPPPPGGESDSVAAAHFGEAPGEHDGKLALIFGIIGLFIGPLSLLALYYAFKGQREVEENGATVGSSLKAGRVLAWVSLALFILTVPIAIITMTTG